MFTRVNRKPTFFGNGFTRIHSPLDWVSIHLSFFQTPKLETPKPVDFNITPDSLHGVKEVSCVRNFEGALIHKSRAP